MKIENEEMIADFGALGYDTKKMASILNIPVTELESEMSKDSEFRRLYNKGIDRSDYVIDKKLFELAKNGDLKALDKFEMRKNKRRAQNDAT